MRSDLHEMLVPFYYGNDIVVLKIDISILIVVFSDYNGHDHPTSFYGEFSICSDGPINLNQYEKIGKIYLTIEYSN